MPTLRPTLTPTAGPSPVPTPNPSLVPTAAPTLSQTLVKVTSSVTLEGINATEFNADEGMKAAFAQAVLDSAGGAFDEVIDIEAVSGRRRLAGAGGGGIAWVMVSYTGVARVLGTADVASVGADVQDEFSVNVTAAIGNGRFLVGLQTNADDDGFVSVTVDSAATKRAIENADVVVIVTTPEPTAAPSPRPTTLQPTAAPTTTPAGSGGGGGGGEDSGVTIIIVVVVIVVLAFAGAGASVCVVLASLRKDKDTKVAPAEDGAAAVLTATETANEEALKRHGDVTEVVATGMGLVNSLLTAGSLVPFVGNIAEVANEFFGSASEFADKADDVVTAARRVVEVLELVTLMNKNAESLVEGKEIVEARMRQLLELLRQFHAAVRAFGERGWFKRMWTIREHVDSLAELDRDIKLQLEMFRDASRLATDNVYLERTYRIEQAIERLVAERVQTCVDINQCVISRRRAVRWPARSCRFAPDKHCQSLGATRRETSRAAA